MTTLNELKLTLPMPISVNKAYAGMSIRHKSNAYKTWELHAKIAFDKQNQGYSITGDKWLVVKYVFYTPLFFKNGKRKKIDAFNYEKALSDFLGRGREINGILFQDIIPGFEDSKIRIGTVEKIDSERNEVEITIQEE